MSDKRAKDIRDILIVALLLLAAAGFWLWYSRDTATASAPMGVAATLATSSTVTVGPGAGETTIFATTTPCASRVITTRSQPITLSFSTSTEYSTATSSAETGHLQAASSTVNYDSGVYGCGLWRAYGFSGTTTLTISEFR